MSVQKLRIKKGQYFVTLLNKVVQGLSYNLELLGLYTYLCSLPHDWEFHKNHLQKSCGIGEKKLDKLFNFLIEHQLIEVIHNRDEQGRFTFSDIVVNDGNSFKVIDLTPYRKNGGTVTAGRLGRATKDTFTKDIKTKDIFRSSESDEQKKFDDFWKIYPRKQKKLDALKAWRKKKLDLSATLICNALTERLKTEWLGKEEEFIPLPGSYLRGEMWNDELIKPKTPAEKRNPETIAPLTKISSHDPHHPSYETFKLMREIDEKRLLKRNHETVGAFLDKVL